MVLVAAVALVVYAAAKRADRRRRAKILHPSQRFRTQQPAITRPEPPRALAPDDDDEFLRALEQQLRDQGGDAA